MAKLDDIDARILQELVRDSNQSIPKLSRKINVNTSVVYSRIKRLVRRGIIRRFTVEVDEAQLGYTVSAYVGVSSDSKKRDAVLEGLRGLAEVREVAEVTGRFDFIVLVKARGLEELHSVISQKIGMLDGVEHTETFISMRHESKPPEIRLGQREGGRRPERPHDREPLARVRPHRRERQPGRAALIAVLGPGVARGRLRPPPRDSRIAQRCSRPRVLLASRWP